jgi:cell division initiation protein
MDKKPTMVPPLAIKLSGGDIRKKEFERSFRGFSTTEVQEYLEMLAGCWDRMQKQEKDLLSALQGLHQELETWRAREGEMKRMREDALAEAEEIRSRARAEATERLKEAEDCASRVREQTETWLEDVIARVEETQRRKANFVTAFRSALDSHYELLKQEQSADSPLSEQLNALLRGESLASH